MAHAYCGVGRPGGAFSLAGARPAPAVQLLLDGGGPADPTAPLEFHGPAAGRRARTAPGPLDAAHPRLDPVQGNVARLLNHQRPGRIAVTAAARPQATGDDPDAIGDLRGCDREPAGHGVVSVEAAGGEPRASTEPSGDPAGPAIRPRWTVRPVASPAPPRGAPAHWRRLCPWSRSSADSCPDQAARVKNKSGTTSRVAVGRRRAS